MTEAEWLLAVDPEPMLEHLRGHRPSRLFRLFATSCCRRIWSHLSDDCRNSVELAERFADDLTSDMERMAAREAVHKCCIYVDGESMAEDRLHGFASEAVLNTLFGDDDYPPIPTYATTCAIAAARASVEVIGAVAEIAASTDSESAFFAACDAEAAAQAALVRTMFGNPFTSTVEG